LTTQVTNQPLHGPVYDFGKLGFGRGEVIVVTGGGSGIGRATAITAAASGLTVGIWDMNAQGARETEEAIRNSGGMALAVTCNVGDDDAVAEAWRATDALGPCRYLVNNAGPPAVSEPFYENVLLAIGSVYRVTTSWMERYGAQAVSAVNMASVSGNFQGSQNQAHYPTSKGGVAALTRHLAVKYGGKPRVNSVAPGFTITPRTQPYLENEDVRQRVSRIPMQRLGYPEEQASTVMFLLSPAASYINGVLLPVDGGWILA
jgi:NAD(P)-dependent dehydrogenase (short-subunit alcohol dehydrogenase family)